MNDSKMQIVVARIVSTEQQLDVSQDQHLSALLAPQGWHAHMCSAADDRSHASRGSTTDHSSQVMCKQESASAT
jgi:hypothetical protein